ncbi:MAG TPA: GDSL-type esterase/lipase family protein [Vicinamibacterales bacterium]|nr:GDSL-type esterase/lipase family protein [Vicinamibacterales bacterium]
MTPTTGGPAITCPTPVTQSSGIPVPVTYGDPTITGGQAPFTLSCSPVSGATYSVGTTPVTCNVTDALQRSDHCTFSVTVQKAALPRLSVKKFLAFGDSITDGEIPDPTDTPLTFHPSIVQRDKAYPQDLQGLLQQRYADPAISVINDGRSKETTTQGLARLRGELAANTPDVLLLLEGVNDLDGTATAQQTALNNLQTMIQTARGLGIQVIVGTLTPQNPPGECGCRVTAASAALVVQFNPLLTSMAKSAGALVVDVYAGLLPDLTDWISPLDGEHPTAAGYQQMAQLFFATIEANFELPPVPSSSPARTGSSATPAAAGPGSRPAAPARPAVRGSGAPSRGKSR